MVFVIWCNGTAIERTVGFLLIVVWALLLEIDLTHDRLNQPRYVTRFGLQYDASGHIIKK